jgi:Tfp pilus assembly protein PilO
MRLRGEAWGRGLRRVLLGLLAVNVAVFATYTAPRLLTRRSQEREVQVLRAEVAREQAIVGAMRDRATTVEANERDTRRFLARVLEPASSGLMAVLSEIEKDASEAGLELQSRTMTHDGLRGLPVVRVAINLPVRGSYADLVAFVERLEASRRFLVVDAVALRRHRAGGEAEMNVDLSAYFREAEGATDGS